MNLMNWFKAISSPIDHHGPSGERSCRIQSGRKMHNYGLSRFTKAADVGLAPAVLLHLLPARLAGDLPLE